MRFARPAVSKLQDILQTLILLRCRTLCIRLGNRALSAECVWGVGPVTRAVRQVCAECIRKNMKFLASDEMRGAKVARMNTVPLFTLANGSKPMIHPVGAKLRSCKGLADATR
jgi:hypothetical protein